MEVPAPFVARRLRDRAFSAIFPSDRTDGDPSAREDDLIRSPWKAAAAAMTIAALGAISAQAQTWPQRQLTFVVPFAAGGGTDAFARPLAAQLDSQLGVRVLIENKAGAGGTAGASYAAKAAPDGYTFFVGAAHHAIAPALYPKLDYDLLKDFVPIAMISQPPQIIVVHPGKVAAKSLKELIDFAAANPDKLNYGHAGNGTTHHLAGEMFKVMTKTRIRAVPYRGAGPAMADLVSGHVEMMFDGLGSSAPQVSAGALRALAVAAPKRTPAFPDVPTAAEAGLPGYEMSTWYAIWAPKGAPAEAVERMRREVRAALDTPTIKEAWARNGSDIPTIQGEELTAFAATEVARWAKVAKEADVRLD